MRTMKFGVLMAAALAVSCCGGGGSAQGSSLGDALAKGGSANSNSVANNTASTTGSTTTTTSGSTSTTTATATSTSRPPMGVNVEGLSDWARLQPFVDMMKTSRPWGTADAPWQATTQVDALGWPTGDAGVVVAVQTVDTGDTNSTYQYLASGVYRLRFTGKATVTPTASANVEVRNYLYDATTNLSTADVAVGTGATQLMLGFRGTTGGVQNVSLLRPGYTADQTFTNEFVSAMAPFGVVRFMDFLATNATRVSAWSDRTTPASATQATSKGGAYEYTVQIANQLGKDIWINIPVLADDTYIRSLATLLKQSLAPGRVVYLEYSNELWNSIFPQTTDNKNAAVAEAIAGDTTLTKGTLCTQAMFDASQGDCNPYWAGYFRVGKRIVRISQIFADVFGAGAINTTVRPVYATQWASSNIAEQVLKNIATYRGTPSSLIYGVATAPYLYLPQSLVTATTLTVPQILQGLQTSLDVNNAPYFDVGTYVNGTYTRGVPYTGGDWTQSSHKALANYYKIKSIAYEAGTDMGQSSVSAPVKFQANKDTGMGGIVNGELAQWYGCGNDLFMYYNLSSAWGSSGYWGLTNNPTDLSSPKYAAAMAVAQSAWTSWTTCR